MYARRCSSTKENVNIYILKIRKHTYRDEKMQHLIMIVVMMIQRDMCSNFILFSLIESQCCYNETNHMRFVESFV